MCLVAWFPDVISYDTGVKIILRFFKNEVEMSRIVTKFFSFLEQEGGSMRTKMCPPFLWARDSDFPLSSILSIMNMNEGKF